MGGCSDSATDLCLSVYTVIQGFAELTLPPTALPSHHHRPHRPSSPSPPVLPPSLPRAHSALPRSPTTSPLSTTSCGPRARSPCGPFPLSLLAQSAFLTPHPFLSTRHRPFWRTLPTPSSCSPTTMASPVFRSHSLNPGLNRACPIWGAWTRGCGYNSSSSSLSSEYNSREMAVSSIRR